MLTAGNVIYFAPFYFKNGEPAKNKYFIILRNIDDKIIIATLPTSSNKAPSLIEIVHGCIDNQERCFNCYIFQEKKPVCTNEFYFELNTYVYGNDVENYEAANLNKNHAIEGVDYEIMGKLKDNEYNDLYKCIKTSKSVKQRIKKLL